MAVSFCLQVFGTTCLLQAASPNLIFMDVSYLLTFLAKLGTPGLSGVAFVGLAIWMGRELIKLKRELLEQRLMREKALLSNVKELESLKDDLPRDKYTAIEAFVSGVATQKIEVRTPSDFWWRFKWAAAVGLAITVARYAAVLLIDAPNVITPRAAVLPQIAFGPVGMLVGVVLIPVATGFLVGRYPTETRSLRSVAVLASLIALALPFAFAVVVLVPLSLML
ncbi:MAG: hypothetical protein AAGF27_08370 [Pseudomonadota bacterium]